KRAVRFARISFSSTKKRNRFYCCCDVQNDRLEPWELKMIRRLVLRSVSLLALAILASALALPFVGASGEEEKTVTSVIRITPPAPVFDDAKRLDELAARRMQVAEAIGSKAILKLFSAEPRVYANDF